MVKARLALASLMLLGSLPMAVAAQTEVAPGSLIKSGNSSAVYYVDEDLSRHVFPNGRIFMTWYENFDGVITLTDAELAEYPLAGNVPYKPGKIMVKLQSDPKTYAVDEGGVLRWVKTEAMARALYGAMWNQLIQDLSDAFFVDYQVGDDVDDDADFDQDQGKRKSDLLKTLFAKRLKKLAKRGAHADELENRGYGKMKVAACHNFGRHGMHTIYIPFPALKAHIGHVTQAPTPNAGIQRGRHLGPCARDRQRAGDPQGLSEHDGLGRHERFGHAEGRLGHAVRFA